MPSFFTFQQGTESRARPTSDASPLLGRFRAVPGQRRGSLLGKRDGILASLGGSVGYGTLFGSRERDGLEDGDYGNGGQEEIQGWKWRNIRDVWLEPKQGAVRRVVERWWMRWGVLVVLPAAIVVGWCALPFPQYPLPDDGTPGNDAGKGHEAPGHGDARAQVNFWFFLFVYYGLYNVTALMWITKVFNIYSLNWWPQSIGFPITVSIIAIISIVVPIPIYYFPESRAFLLHNTVWIFWTFIIMAMPVMVAFGILMNHERHLGLRQSLSETQRIFTQSWWNNETDVDTMARRERRRPAFNAGAFDPDAPLDVTADNNIRPPVREAVRLRKLWIPASFMRFMWFCLALFIGLLAYVLGETYAEIYLRTLPHNNLETVVYVYSWVVTIHLLDGVTGWILGGGEGERVGSYPLGWIFKLYFSLTYQTYVRALYARLRSPSQFITLQLLSSTSLVLFQPLSMSTAFHSLLSIIGLNNQPYPEYRKYCGRSIFIRNIAENVSMLAFLGQVVVLHYGANKAVYPYFAFDDVVDGTLLGSLFGHTSNRSSVPGIGDGNEKYTFEFTFQASSITWACEIVAAWIVRRIVQWFHKFDVTREGVLDLGAWPELLPTGVAVMVHVLQNMLFGIIRLSFH